MKKSFLTLSVFVWCVSAAVAQKAELAPIEVKPSTFLEDARKLRTTNPGMSLAELVVEANNLLDKHGVNFSLSLDAATCAKIGEAKAKQKDPGAPIRLSGALKSVDGDRAKLALPPAQFADERCGGCYLDIPLLQITKTSFITILLGRNIGFELPGNVTPVQAVLLDAEEGRTVKRTWAIPERLVPIGISHDENVLYLAFKEPELSDLSLAVFTEGTFQIATRADAEDGGKGQKVDLAAPMSQMRFKRWGKTYVVGYHDPCRY